MIIIPGAIIHAFACNDKAWENRLLQLGIEAPDMQKNWAKQGIQYFFSQYNRYKEPGMPPPDAFFLRASERENCCSSAGTHYGVSSNPNIELFWNGLTQEQKDFPYYRGYLFHLLTDKLVYTKLHIDECFCANAIKEGVFLETPEYTAFARREKKILHLEWDALNTVLTQKYPLKKFTTPELQELNVVSFLPLEQMPLNGYKYVIPEVIFEVIEFLEQFDPLNTPEIIIDAVNRKIQGEEKNEKGYQIRL